MAKRDIIRAAKRAGYKVISADYYWTTSPGERVPEWQVVYQDTAEVFEQEVETFDDSAHAVSFFEGLAGEVSMANDELMRLAERVEALATDWTLIEEAEKRDAIAADLRAQAQRAPQHGAVPERWTEDRLRAEAKARGWYVREGTSVPTADGNWRHPFEVTIPSRDLCALLATPAPEAERAKGEVVAQSVDAYLRIDPAGIEPTIAVMPGDRERWADIGYELHPLGVIKPTAPPPAGQPEGVEALARSIYEAWRAERRCKDIPAHPWETVAPATKDIWRNIASRLASAQRAGKDGA